MGFAAKKIAAGYVADTNAKMTAASMPGLKKALVGPAPGTPLLALIRYVSLSRPPSPSDITAPERDLILDDGSMCLGLVQHVNEPGWIATNDNGTAHGVAAAGHAKLIEYPAGCHIGVDMEGIHDVGQPVLDYLKSWLAAVHAAGYLAVIYWGYAFQVAPAAVVALLSQGDIFWTDYGSHPAPPGVGWTLKQHAQSMVGGTMVDLDEDVGVDGRGNSLVLMALVADVNVETTDSPHADGIPLPFDTRDTEEPPPATEPNPSADDTIKPT